MGRRPRSQIPLEVRQDDPDNLQVQVGHDNDTPHFATLAHGVNTSVWNPDDDHYIHLKNMIVSVEGAGMVQIFRDATEWCRLHFSEKKAVPIGFASEIALGQDVELKATFTADNATDAAYITALGHEHEG